MVVFAPEFLDEIRARVSLAGAIGARTKLVRSGRNWKACCPFHGEKTPSFYVYDDHFHCFGCEMHGDVIKFTMEIGNLSFRDAVEKLAGEAGLKIPVTPRDDFISRQREKTRNTARRALEIAGDLYKKNLQSSQSARLYLQNRGITPQTADKFGLGWAGKGDDLRQALISEGIPPQTAFEAGLLRSNDRRTLADGAVLKSWDDGRAFFYDRLMIPIHDAKGVIASFGGRTLGDGQPKYINGPETVCFHKKRTLYNFHRARANPVARDRILVVEGYLDVIALDQFGFETAVAPLGTAVGEEQLKILWRVNAAPVFCLDGDKAGRNAALRVCERALEILEVGYSLKFCFLPEGDDPDSLIRAQGAQAFEKRLENSLSLAVAAFGLWESEIVRSPDDPDDRARFRKKLTDMSAVIPDKNVSAEYRALWLDLFFEKYRKKTFSGAPYSNQNFKKSYKRNAASKPSFSETLLAPVSSSLHNSVRHGSVKRLEDMTAVLLAMPDLLPELEGAYWNITLEGDMERVRDYICENPELTDLDEIIEPDAFTHYLVSLRERGRKLITGQDEPARVRALSIWWEGYGFMDLKAFEREVREAELPYILGQAEGEYPEALKARREALFALKRGETYQSDRKPL